MTVKDLITRLLDEPMNAEVMLQTDYDKPVVESYHNNVRSVTKGVVFGIDSFEHSGGRIFINFTDWRKETQDEVDLLDAATRTVS